MKFFLRNFCYNQRLSVDYDFPQLGLGAPPVDPNKSFGVYCQLGRDVVGLFAMFGNLFLYFNGTICDISDQEQVATHSRVGAMRELALKLGQERHVIAYPDPGSPIYGPDWTEEEIDADFGFWLQETLNSPEARQGVIRNWSNGFNC